MTRQNSSDSQMSSPNRVNRQGTATMNKEQRELEQREIKSFVQQAFQEVPRFTIE